MTDHASPPSALSLPDGRRLDLAQPRIMGILNVTPDSFSDGGAHQAGEAVDHAMRMLAEGAAIIDVGGESTRPGSQRVSVDEQIRRTVNVIRELVDRARRVTGEPAVVSIDTTRMEVARAALDAGATILNDVSAGRDDPGMFDLAAERGAPIVLMHMRGQPATMQQDPTYDDVVGEVHAFLLERAQQAIDAGVPREQVVLDPGIGFGKTREHNLALIAALPELTRLGFPVLLGASRKRFMGSLCQGPARAVGEGYEAQPPQPTDLVGATCATTVLAALAGAAMIRVHDVLTNAQALTVAQAVRQAGG